jgi:uncharacterized membrane protein
VLSGDLLIRLAVHVALAFYVAGVLFRLSKRNRPARFLWTAGCVAFLLHVAAAFHFVHHWSHDAAYAETARQTNEVVGLNWGGGIYFNYLFAAVWLGDVIWWWHNPATYLARPRWIEWLVQGFLAFIVFNATVVFGHGPIRWAGLGATVLIIAFWVAVGFSRRNTG